MMNGYHRETDRKTIIITGGNSGVGFALAQRLLALEITLNICLACRNISKAEKAQSQLLVEYPGARVDVLQLDTSSITSVNGAAKEIQRRYRKIDYLYLNAGTMAETSLDWANIPRIPLQGWSATIDAISTGEGMIKMMDGTAEDGLKLTFATNLFGHFLLVRKLEKFMSVNGGRIIWTSSSNARRKHFNMDDIQHKNGIQPYSSSKYAVNLLSMAINERLSDSGVSSHVISPGFSVTGMTSPLVSDVVWALVHPIFFVLRLVIATMCVTAWNSAEALIWLYRSDPSDINPGQLHSSCVSVLGKRYVKSEPIEFREGEPEELYQKLVALQADMEDS